MSVSEINATILAIGNSGKRGKYNLSIANDEIEKYLKSTKAKVETEYGNSHWEHRIALYLNHPVYKKAERYYKIEGNDHPVHIEDSRLFIIDNIQSINKIKRDKWAVIAELHQHIPIVLDSHEVDGGTYTTSESKIKTLERVLHESKKLFKILKEKEDEIVPGRKLALLFDNDYKLFTPSRFKDYIHRNAHDAGVGYTNELLEN